MSPEETSLNALRGEEGAGAKVYFDVFDDMILQNKADFFFHERSRRPPLDHVNALLSFAYSLLSSDCAAALESVGSMPMSASCTGTARGGPHSRWILWKNCGPALPTGSCCR